ncbi:MAG: tRNA threonylcarbamoyladenosine dehydratase [Candidimonas sp.]|nr:MAG: tRNA threonylcarbamoyladenosine dehydratase [Candidimonas sp.]TAM21048.1 MAG: tRNA threonylcarbamoyladenosine dehydratase [Candidimonas sp.]
MPDTPFIDMQRRFGGIERLYGPSGLERLRVAHIAVAGIGGVGSWCVEALARSGVGALTLIDLDHIAESNINRQLHALTDTLGVGKTEAMARRIAGINPDCRVRQIDDFVTPENVRELLAHDVGLLVDCTDQASAKIAMILEARDRRLPLVVCGGAGGKTNPLALRASDLSQALNDALLAKLRNSLRRQHGYPKASDQAGKPRKRIPKMGVRVVWFDQPARLPTLWMEPVRGDAGDEGLQGLSCSGYGSLVTVTAAMGLAAASEAMHYLLEGRFSPSL